jgi:hypothetical protein
MDDMIQVQYWQEYSSPVIEHCMTKTVVVVGISRTHQLKGGHNFKARSDVAHMTCVPTIPS